VIQKQISSVGLILIAATFFAGNLRGDDYSSGPRAGKYLILSYGATNRPPLVLGSCVLSEGGKYEAFLPGDNSQGEGTYTYDAAKREVTWKTGPYVGQWEGKFEIDREGKTHKIRLKRTTIATNSTDG
jgi:hypothetical protein